MIFTAKPLVALALVLGCLCTAQAFAAEPKPALSVKTQAIAASVSLDDLLKADQPLADNLLAEGKRWIEKNRADAAKEFKASPELFRDGRPWTFERDYTTASVVAGRYVSMLRTDYFYTGGAHPNHDIDTILWDRAAKKRISIRPFFTETANDGPTMKAMRAAVVRSLAEEKKARGTDTPAREWAKDLKPRLIGIGAVSLAPATVAGKSAGLLFHYPPYAVGAYAEGPYEAFVPWQALKSHLSTEGAAIFAGERTKTEAAQ